MDIHRLHLDGSEARIAPAGAELQALRLDGTDLLWTAGPLWPRHAPLLFPIVGALSRDQFRHRGATFPMPKHGFARNRNFTWVERDATRCVLELEDDAATRQNYPFAFRLRVTYTLGPAGLRMALDLHNPGTEPLPASLGLHPAFRWPLVPHLSKSSHRLVFERDEPGPLRRLDAQGLVTADVHPTPIQGRSLPLREDLFEDDALLFLEPRSRGLRFEAEGGLALALRWEGFPHLGIWTKPDPGPAYLCIEPWEGHADPAGWEGEFTDKPGGFLLQPGANRHWSLEVALAR
ncbi:MAG TPA: aldose 1-epimerase family protein [Geothrix sp.]|nr:aldose 1-epimerase family protein [Geothrix sp.]